MTTHNRPTLLIIFSWAMLLYGCSSDTKPKAVASAPKAKEAKPAIALPNTKNTAHFDLTNKKRKHPLDFNDDNTLSFENGISLKIIETTEELFSLQVKHNDIQLLTVDSLQNISKVWLDNDKLCFSVFTFFNEDGFNEGFAYIIDIKTDTVLKYPAKLKNTCNPVVYNGTYCFLDGGLIKQTTEKLELFNTIQIQYHPTKNKTDLSYLDTYSVGYLSTSTGALQIAFTPERVNEIKLYRGIIKPETKYIFLHD